MEYQLFSSSFCGPCRRARAVLDRAVRLVPGAKVVEYDVAIEAHLAEGQAITSTPTTVLRTDAGVEVLRATGVPTLNQVLVAAARALDQEER